MTASYAPRLDDPKKGAGSGGGTGAGGGIEPVALIVVGKDGVKLEDLLAER
jgi:uncharacterized spore protein YtfJ